MRPNACGGPSTGPAFQASRTSSPGTGGSSVVAGVAGKGAGTPGSGVAGPPGVAAGVGGSAGRLLR